MRSLLFLIIPFLTFSAKPYPLIKYQIPQIQYTIRIPLLDGTVNEKYKDSIINACIDASIEINDLAAICFAESSMMKITDHPNDLDISPFGLHETKEIHAERVEKWGPYDPHNINEAARISALEYKEELDKFNNKALAFSAYHRGTNWVDKNGVCHYYIKMINNYMEDYCGREAVK